MNASSPASIEFLGAAGTVTGSRTLLRWRGQRWLVDCGLFQGDKTLRERNWTPFQPDASSVSQVVLTHAHLDHSGYLPRLYRQGFRGEVLCSAGTADLLQILLRDAAKLQAEDSEYANRTGHSAHKPALPLFTDEDVDGVLSRVRPVERDTWVPLGRDASVRFLRAGHITGACSVQFALSQGNQDFTITFSGDRGHDRSVIFREPDPIFETDWLILESTYGSRRHEEINVADQLAEVIGQMHRQKGVLLIPAFAVGRAQEVLHLIRKLEDQHAIPPTPVILDSPMSAAATQVFLKHSEDHLLSASFVRDPTHFFPHLFETAESTDESMLACMRKGPLVVLSASGMLAGGRILHHLKHRLPHSENIVLFVGYQAEGTKGRFLQDEGKTVGRIRIHHQEVPVEATIATLPSLSAHADAKDLLDGLARLRRPPLKIFINHGDPEASQALKTAIRSRFGWDAQIAVQNEVISLENGMGDRH